MLEFKKYLVILSTSPTLRRARKGEIDMDTVSTVSAILFILISLFAIGLIIEFLLSLTCEFFQNLFGSKAEADPEDPAAKIKDGAPPKPEPAPSPRPEKRPRKYLSPRKRGEWQHPEIKKGTFVTAFSPPSMMNPHCVAGYGRVVSRGARRARIELEDGKTIRRSVKNLHVGRAQSRAFRPRRARLSPTRTA